MIKSNGFTLLELMVVVAIVAILATIAMPALTRLIQINTIASNANVFMSDLRYARSEAIRRGGAVIVCRSDDPEASSPSCNTGTGPGANGWVSGWIVFQDLDLATDGGNKDATDPVLRIQSPITSVNSIVENSSSPVNKFRFTATGRMLNLSSATSLRFGAGPRFASDVQKIVCVNRGGRARIAGDGAAGC